jgi:hypothetical protein
MEAANSIQVDARQLLLQSFEGHYKALCGFISNLPIDASIKFTVSYSIASAYLMAREQLHLLDFNVVKQDSEIQEPIKDDAPTA